MKLQQDNSELKINTELLEIKIEKSLDIQNSLDNKEHLTTLQQENSALKNEIKLLELKNKKLEPKKVLLDITNENNLLNRSTQSNHGQTFSPYKSKARLERQVSNFRRQHI